MTAPTCRQSIAWLGLRLAVPAEWEIVRHSISTLKGGLTLVDRRRQRLQLRWTACRKPPLIEKMLEDHRSRQLKEDPDAAIAPYEVGRWQGLVRELDEQMLLTRVARYQPEDRVLIEAVLSHSDDELELRDAVIEAIDLAEPMKQAREWSAFGMRVRTPEDFQATSTSVNAGEVAFSFAQYNKPGGDKLRPGRATLCRMGLADGWFRGDLSRFLKVREPKLTFDIDERVLDEGFTGGPRATAVFGTCIERGPRIKRFAGRLRTRRDLLWHDPQANAVFHIHTLSFEKSPVLPTDFLLQPAKEAA